MGGVVPRDLPLRREPHPRIIRHLIQVDPLTEDILAMAADFTTGKAGSQEPQGLLHFVN